MTSIIHRAWNSPTFTEWAAKLLRPLRLVLVTPLILTLFTEAEIAAWYLFASISFLGQILESRITLTFSRMISMAYGGAKDLTKIVKMKKFQGDAEPNWAGVIQVYQSLPILQLLVTLVSVVIATIIGYFSLGNIVNGVQDSSKVWMAFGIIQFTTLLIGSFGYLMTVLIGLNHVALVNRWNVIFGLVSVLGGVLSLSFGGGIVMLAIVMQGTLLAGVVRNYCLVRRVNGGRLRQTKKFSFKLDKTVFGWSWDPLWKGFISQLANHGVLHIGSLVFTFYASTAGIASFLFSLSIMRAMQQFAMSPFSSQMPRFTKMMSQGRSHELAVTVSKRVMICQLILIIGILVAALCGPYLLGLIGAKGTMLEVQAWLVLGLIFLHERFNTYHLAICGAGNNMVLYWRQASTGGVSLILMFVLIPYFGVWGIMLSMLLPVVFVMNWQAPRFAVEQLGQDLLPWLKRTATPTLAYVTILFFAFTLMR